MKLIKIIFASASILFITLCATGNYSPIAQDDGYQHAKIERASLHIVLPQRSMIDAVSDFFSFMIEFIKHPTTVGSIIPSSKWLAKEIVSGIPNSSKPTKRFILEVGPGTGAFTDKILKRMNENDELHLVEYDAAFCTQLQNRYKTLIEKGKVKIYNCSILDHAITKKYDYIVSGLPLNAFEAQFVDQVFDKFVALSKEGSKLSYFDYPIAREVVFCFANKQDRQRLEHIKAAKESFYNSHRDHEKTIYLNLPPARVLHHSM